MNTIKSNFYGSEQSKDPFSLFQLKLPMKTEKTKLCYENIRVVKNFTGTGLPVLKYEAMN